jgi:hypothetical protein
MKVLYTVSQVLAADSLGKKFNMPLAYNEKADKESWQEMQNVFNKVFSK